MTAKISEPDEAHKSNRDDEILAREKNVRSLFPRDAKKKQNTNKVSNDNNRCHEIIASPPNIGVDGPQRNTKK
jgi:hypothetical protein